MPHARPGSDHHSMWSACLPVCVCAPDWSGYVAGPKLDTDHEWPWLPLLATHSQLANSLLFRSIAFVKPKCILMPIMPEGAAKGEGERAMDGNRNCARFSFNNKGGTFWPTFSYENCLRTKVLKWHSGK